MTDTVTTVRIDSTEAEALGKQLIALRDEHTAIKARYQALLEQEQDCINERRGLDRRLEDIQGQYRELLMPDPKKVS